MPTMRALLLMLTLLFAGGASALEARAPVAAVKPDPVVAKPLPAIANETKPVGAPKKSFIWEVKSAANTVFLFGTIHVGKRDFYPLPEAVESAFKDSAKLVVEADISDQSGFSELPALMTFAPPDSLDKHVPPELFARLGVQLARLKLPPAAIRSMRPFMVAGLLSVTEFSRIGYEASHGVDAYLIRNARAAMKPILELETVKGQVTLLASMPPDLQRSFLENTVASLEGGGLVDQVIGVINAWQSGDAALMQEVADAANRGMGNQPALDEVLIHRRNAEMLKKIEGYLAAKDKHFIAVGSLHLTGLRGLVALLKAKGYEVTQR
jgi:uncharacterized protein